MDTMIQYDDDHPQMIANQYLHLPMKIINAYRDGHRYTFNVVMVIIYVDDHQIE